MVYLIYCAHTFREDFEAIVQSIETALDKTKTAEKTPIIVFEFAGADVALDDKGEGWIRSAAFSRSSRIWSVRLRVVHKIIKSSFNSQLRDFVKGKKPLSEFHSAINDKGFGLAFVEYLKSRNIRFVIENVGFEAWILGEMQQLLTKDVTDAFMTCDERSYFDLFSTRVNVNLRRDQKRDHDLAVQIRRMLKKRSISPIVVRGALHRVTLEPWLTRLGIEFEVLLTPSGPMPPLEDVILKRQIHRRVDTQLSDDERLQFLRQPLFYEFDQLLRESTGSRSHLSSYQAAQTIRPIVDRWTRQDLDAYFSSTSAGGRRNSIFLWIERNCTEAEKRRFHHYRTLPIK